MTILRTTKRRLAYAVTLTLAGMTADQSVAQFVPLGGYSQPTQQIATNQQAPSYQAQYAPQGQYIQQEQPAYTGQGNYQAVRLPATQPAAASYQSQQPTLQEYQAAQQRQLSQQIPQYRIAAATENLPQPAPEALAPTAAPHSGPVHQYSQPSYPEHASHAAPIAHTAPSSDCGCNTQASPSWESYVQAPSYSSGCATGDCATGGCTDYSSYGSCAPACDVGCQTCGPKRQWFGGVYALYMNRTDRDKYPLTVSIPDVTAITTPYYPTEAGSTFLFSANAGTDAEWGNEIRFGSTFGSDPCGCQQPFAWEFGYWGLQENSSVATQFQDVAISSTNNRRIYGARNYAGIEWDRGAGYRSLNDYADYQMPIENGAPNDVRRVGITVRQSFDIQNLELNFWRFGNPMAAPSIGSQCVSSSSCGTGCYPNGCGTSSFGTNSMPRRFFINGLMGVRYVKMDDDFWSANDFGMVDGAGDPTGDYGTFYDEIKTDNQMVGFQLGSSMNWLVGCKWNFFADSNFGIYGNQMNVYQRLYGNGDFRFVSNGGDAVVDESRTEVAFLGELRAGVGYQISCNCRLTAAYRALAFSGLALSSEQDIDFTNPEIASHIDTNGSLILHGLQTGVEFKY